MLLYRYCFDLLCKDNFQVQTTGGLYSEGRFNGGFFALRVWGGLYLEGLINGGACLFSEFYGIVQHAHVAQYRKIPKISPSKYKHAH